MHEPQIWIYNVAAEPDDLRPLLSDQERVRAGGFRFEEDRRRFTIAHARLREVLAACVGGDPASLQFGSGVHGKPFLCGGGVEFSLSHSGDIVLIAVAGVPVGVDVERVQTRDGIDRVARESFNSAELEWLREQPDRTRAFYRLWTIKEAALKGDGKGISAGLQEVSVDMDRFDRLVLRGARWSVREIKVDSDYCAAVAIPADSDGR